MTFRIRFVGIALVLAAITLALLASGPAAHAKDSKEAKPAPPRPPADSAAVAAGAKIFGTYCVTCHGVKGKGDGVAAAGLNPKPRNFTDPKQFKSKDDDGLYAVINKGGGASKLSAVMPAWGKILKPDQIWNVIAYVRHFAPKAPAAADTAKAAPSAK